jgi:hypothetical protein
MQRWRRLDDGPGAPSWHIEQSARRRSALRLTSRIAILSRAMCFAAPVKERPIATRSSRPNLQEKPFRHWETVRFVCDLLPATGASGIALSVALFNIAHFETGARQFKWLRATTPSDLLTWAHSDLRAPLAHRQILRTLRHQNRSDLLVPSKCPLNHRHRCGRNPQTSCRRRLEPPQGPLRHRRMVRLRHLPVQTPQWHYRSIKQR